MGASRDPGEGVAMLQGFSRMSRAAKSLVAAATMLTALTISLGAATSSSALGSSPFCTTLFTWETQYASKDTPPTSLAGYRAWAKELLPFYEKLASEAPNAATKNTLNEVVTILQFESKKLSTSALDAYVLANKAKWLSGTKALAKAIESCA